MRCYCITLLCFFFSSEYVPRISHLTYIQPEKEEKPKNAKGQRFWDWSVPPSGHLDSLLDGIHAFW